MNNRHMEDIPEHWPAEMRQFWSMLKDQGEATGRDMSDGAQETKARRQELAAETRLEIALTWPEGWRHFDAVLFAMEQHALHMLQRSDTDDSHLPMRTAITLLHISATMTLHEIHALLAEGFVTGAAARWRALHELATTAILVANGGAEMAQRYLDHGFVVQAKRLEAFYAQPHPDAPTSEVRKERLQRVDELMNANTLPDQSSSFAGAYGWAIPLMGRRKDSKYLDPSFDRLEKLAGLERLRLLMTSAHGHVHNDSGGIRQAVMVGEEGILLNRRSDQINTVAKPTFDTVIVMVAATHLGFEPELNDFAKLLGLMGTGLCRTAALARDAFPPKDMTTLRLF
jgi:hypothetical protein